MSSAYAELLALDLETIPAEPEALRSLGARLQDALRAVLAEHSKCDVRIKDANTKLFDASKRIRDLEAQVSSMRDDLAELSKSAEATEEAEFFLGKKIEEEGLEASPVTVPMDKSSFLRRPAQRPISAADMSGSLQEVAFMNRAPTGMTYAGSLAPNMGIGRTAPMAAPQFAAGTPVQANPFAPPGSLQPRSTMAGRAARQPAAVLGQPAASFQPQVAIQQPIVSGSLSLVARRNIMGSTAPQKPAPPPTMTAFPKMELGAISESDSSDSEDMVINATR